MKSKPLIVMTIIYVISAIPISSFGQAAKVNPENPKWGDNLEVIYDPRAESAKLLPGDEVYTVFFVYFGDSSETRWAKMQKEGEVFKYVIPVKEDMAFLIFYFLSSEEWDRKAEASTMVFRRDGLPAKGAYLGKITHPFLDENYLEFFKKELELYPDNFSAYRTKWFLQGAFETHDLEHIVKQDIDLLEKEVKDEPANFLYSLSYGYMLLGEEENSRKILKKMVDRYPESFYTGEALDDYEAQVFSKQIKGEGPKEVEKMRLEVIKKNPKSRFAREKVLYLASNKEVSLALIEAICKPWMIDEPDHPTPYFSLAYACSERKQKLSRAAEFMDRAINLLLQGKLRLYEDISGTITEIRLPQYYQISSDIQFQLGDYAKALADIRAAKSTQKEPRPEYHIKEAKIWEKAGSYQRAEKAYFEALRLGSDEARDSLRTLYVKRHGSADGFERYLTLGIERHRAESSEMKEVAPDFDVVTLDGKKLRLSEMKGKAVVLNFWYIGCAPCRVEMPSLNSLTEEFKGRDVVFIAFTSDQEKDLKDFLEKNPFKYQIVPNAGEIAKKFGVRVYPTHIIINKEGRIEYRLTGGSVTRHEQLRPLIADILRN